MPSHPPPAWVVCSEMNPPCLPDNSYPRGCKWREGLGWPLPRKRAQRSTLPTPHTSRINRDDAALIAPIGQRRQARRIVIDTIERGGIGGIVDDPARGIGRVGGGPARLLRLSAGPLRDGDVQHREQRTGGVVGSQVVADSWRRCL